ncbi:MAG: hypothetical protein KA169_05870 [Burkholderiaceae bacterium]|nr:hypothetical protein [Burkholderiaceae bacterium]
MASANAELSRLTRDAMSCRTRATGGKEQGASFIHWASVMAAPAALRAATALARGLASVGLRQLLQDRRVLVFTHVAARHE